MPKPRLHDVHANEQLAEAVGVLSPTRARLRPELRRMLRMGIWTPYGNVVVMHNGPLTPEQQVWVAVLRAGRHAVLAATTALTESLVKVTRPAQPYVLVPYTSGRLWVPDAVVRRSRVLAPEDVAKALQPPRLTVARAAVDAASLLREPDDIRAVLCAPVQQRKAKPTEIRSAALRLGPLSGRALILRTVDELELGATSIHEQRVGRIIRRHKLPPPDLQVMRQRANGRAFLDLAWEQYLLHVEIDGLAHLLVRQWVDDLDRSNELEIAKQERRLRFPGFLLIEREAQVVDQLTRALRAGGWRP